MKKISIIIIILIFSNLLFAQTKSATKEGEWKWYIVDDFETCAIWPVINTFNFNNKWLNRDPLVTIVRGCPKALSGKENKKCLGAKIKMDDIGDTRKFIMPVHKVVIPGICKKISFWLNSRNTPLTIKIMFLDYMNCIQILECNPFVLNFYGWKKIEISDIDKKIFQLSSASPDYRALRIVAIIIENPLKKVFYKKVYLYIDHLEGYCRVDELANYDGSEIKDKW